MTPVDIFKDKSNDDNSIIEEESGGVINFGVEARLYSDNDKFYIGGDTGYAVGLYDDGFYFRPKLGFVISENSGFFASYTEINADIKYTTVNIGYEYSF